MTSSPSRTIKKRSSARRCLFGYPKKEEVDAWLSTVDRTFRRMDEEKWGFSFTREMPTSSSTSSYAYEMVDASSVPSFYRATSYIPSTSSIHDEPMDDGVDQENFSLLDTSSSSDESFSSTSSDPPVTPKKAGKKRQAKITNFYSIRRKSAKFSPSKPSTPSLSPVSLPSISIEHI